MLKRMSQDIRILEFGEIPPPFGGVTVHIRRLLDRLVHDGFDLTLVARRSPESLGDRISYVRWPTLPRYLNHFEFFRGLGQPFGDGVLHLHTNPVFSAPLVWLHIQGGGVALITVHDQMIRERLSHALPHERLCFRLLIHSTRVRWIAVSDPVREFLLHTGVAADRINVAPAYLPEQLDESSSGLPPDLAHFLREHPLSMVVYGYRREFLAGRDLYGFDFAIEVLAELLHSIPQAGLVILCPDARRDAHLWRQLLEQAESMGLGENVLFFLQPILQPSSLWQQCRVMLRPTMTDGDSVAVREMLAQGRPVIASDVVPRPANAVVLPLGSPETWARAVVAHTQSTDPAQPEPAPTQDGYAAVKQAILACMADVS
jgi:glycosyltransferase involved in cell wall biosynthesis